MEQSYAVTWHEARRAPYAGRLRLGPASLRFDGAARHGRTLGQTIDLRDLVTVRIARGPEDRVAGRPVLVLERRQGPAVHVATLGDPGALHEARGTLAAGPGRMSTLVVVAPLQGGARAAAQTLLTEGPPFDLEAAALERHEVFVTDREVVFLFEGPDAKHAVQGLAGDPGVWRAAARWRVLLAGRPRIAEPAYSWTLPDG